ncbi:Ion transport protein-domain-containing protein [Gorgonomyces haynaldii]|nr:Ion transport protein-domain-containing protein [Gorgonomyces haynaldii]
MNEFCKFVLESKEYKHFVLSLLLLETVRIFYDAYQFGTPSYSKNVYDTNQILTLVFLGLYIVDFLLKSTQAGFYKSMRTLLDIFVIAMYVIVIHSENTIPDYENNPWIRCARGLRMMQLLRIVSLFRSLEVVVDALISTMLSGIVDAMVILALTAFIFAVIGHLVFSNDGQYAYGWNSIPESILTILVYMFADGWRDYHNHNLKDGYYSTFFISPILIILLNFVIHNVFIGVICQNIDEASKNERSQKQEKQREAKMAKRELFLKKQKRDIHQLLGQKKKGADFQTILKELVGNLKHDEVVPTNQLCENLTWLETFLVTLHYYENTIFICQQTHFAMAHGLGEYVDRRMQTKQNL